MMDGLGRTIDYLRVSVTDRCNLRCRHCMPAGGVEPVSHGEVLSYEEILRIAKVGSGLGIRKIKLTGGEPLVRRGIASLVKGLKGIPGIEDVTMTTNGVLLGGFAEPLAAAGLSAVNVSVHAGNAERYADFARFDAFDDALRGIARSRACGLKTKINCVVSDASHMEDYVNIAGMARSNNLDVRFIEMMPVGFGAGFEAVSLDRLAAALEGRYGPSRPLAAPRGNGPATYREFPGFSGAVGFIAPMSHSFCGDCNRVRLTSTGNLKACLFDPRAVSLRDAMRGGATDGELSRLIAEAIRAKPAEHGACAETASMARIGG